MLKTIFSLHSTVVIAILVISVCAQGGNRSPGDARNSETTGSPGTNQDSGNAIKDTYYVGNAKTAGIMCPKNLTTVIDGSMKAAKQLIKDAIDAIQPETSDWNQQNLNFQTFDVLMGKACDPVAVRNVLHNMYKYSDGVTCEPPNYPCPPGGTLFYSRGSILICKTIQRGPNTSDFLGCQSKDKTLTYRFIHEMAHAPKFNTKNGSWIPIGDGQDGAILDVGAPGKSCYAPDCIKANAEKSEECYNGFNAEAYASLVWTVHCPAT
ncbi:MAG: hypothetical protein M1833_001609 [Piccolia ochrophora]|nr:MAG: hypothetical protein M1833_001609 [Piccolia ochrophora]